MSPEFNGTVTIKWLEPEPALYTPYLIIQAQLEDEVYGWCIDERGWHEFESSTDDYIANGFAACEEDNQ
jgi:hypothetical protein